MSAHLLLAVVLAEVKEFKDIGVPWLDIDGESARHLSPLCSTYGAVASYAVAIGETIRTGNV